ncbi:MAG: SUMF1/EgtB/PvdO family nonheme iron enzyme [Magnetococcales bacterium]|nr:SUMF1/EgtB/PvdO family nonheme iron enzyme [Magnetococcales bacterium]
MHISQPPLTWCLLLGLLATTTTTSCSWPLPFDTDHSEPESIQLQTTRHLGLTPPLPANPTIWQDPNFGISLTRIPGGCFVMGENQGQPHNQPAHTVCLDEFWLAIHETTQSQWRQGMGSIPPQTVQHPTLPVENISWNEISSFISRLNQQSQARYRLPTEAEWEYACRELGQTLRYCGSQENPTPLAWFDRTVLTPQPVGTRQPNKLGLYDMNGNVWEWVADWYDENYYHHAPRHNPTGPEQGVAKVFRGGNILSELPFLRSTTRAQLWPERRNGLLGFRLAGKPP